MIFKLKNDNFKTRDFSPLIERVLTGVLDLVSAALDKKWRDFVVLQNGEEFFQNDNFLLSSDLFFF